MRAKSLVIIAIIGGFSVSFVANNLFYNSTKPPVERTGAPGEKTCGDGSSCHDIEDNLGPGEVTITFNGSDTMYVTDTTYEMRVKVNNDFQSRYGFELTALDTANNRAGTLRRIDSANTSLQNKDGRQYIGHKGADTQSTWRFQWKSPNTGVGAVTFYAAGNAADGGLSDRTGDTIYTDTLRIEMDTSGSQQDTTINNISAGKTADGRQVKIYPNPAQEYLQIHHYMPASANVQVQLLNAQGQLVKRLFQTDLKAGHNQRTTSLSSSLKPGIYFLQFQYDNQHTELQKVMITK